MFEKLILCRCVIIDCRIVGEQCNQRFKSLLAGHLREFGRINEGSLRVCEVDERLGHWVEAVPARDDL